MSKQKRQKFSESPSFGIWADRTGSDEELLEELGSGWRGFATEPTVVYLCEGSATYMFIDSSEPDEEANGG